MDMALNLLASLIFNRSQQVSISDSLSDLVPVLSGVPQGSVLRPTSLSNFCS